MFHFVRGDSSLGVVRCTATTHSCAPTSHHRSRSPTHPPPWLCGHLSPAQTRREKVHLYNWGHVYIKRSTFLIEDDHLMLPVPWLTRPYSESESRWVVAEMTPATLPGRQQRRRPNLTTWWEVLNEALILIQGPSEREVFVSASIRRYQRPWSKRCRTSAVCGTATCNCFPQAVPVNVWCFCRDKKDFHRDFYRPCWIYVGIGGIFLFRVSLVISPDGAYGLCKKKTPVYIAD